MIKLFRYLAFLLFTFVLSIQISFSQNDPYKALFAKTAPKIDGDTNDIVWSSIKTWNTYNQVWLNNVGTTPTAADFSWKFKLAWTEDRFYILAVITDDVLSDKYSNPLDRYYEDDTFEVFFDEDKSGGQHERSFQAFAYHVSLKYDIVDSDQTGTTRLLNDHAEVRMDTVDGKYVWEAAFKVYPSTFTIANPGLPVKLFAGKKMGWGLAYCDNDGRNSRDHFFGSEYVAATNKNIAYQNADVFGTVEMVNPDVPSVPTFSHVLVDNGLTKPTAMRIAPDGDIYVCEQTGGLKVLRNGDLQLTNLVKVNANTSGPSNTERGLLGLALDPDFSNNHYIYLYYTTAEGFIHNRVSRFTLDNLNNVTSTEVIITELDSLSDAAIHNGGAMHFGKDGKLYIATGENSTPTNSQNLNKTHGKLLRINADGSVPEDNPFAHRQGADARVWSYGLRNPFTFDISTSGQILLNDVGFESWEEIDDASVAGKNFGWPIEEGRKSDAEFDTPLYTFQRVLTTAYTDSTGCAITGGTFFEPLTTNYPQEYIGKYYFMDYCAKWINSIDPKTGASRKTFATNVSQYPIAIDHHPDGNLYYLTRGNGSIYKITYSGKPLPVITRQPDEVKVTAGDKLNISVIVSGEEPMTYVWTKNGNLFSSAKTNQLSVSSSQFSDSGTYVLTITNAHGVGVSKPIKVKVLEYNAKPVVSLDPIADTTFYAGQSYDFVGHATDTEDGVLSGASFSWTVDLYHGTHIHDGIEVVGQSTMNFTIPVASGHTETDIFYRVTLIATDSKGLTDTAFVNLYPELVDLKVESIPTGLKFTMDGTPFTAPHAFQSVKGNRRRLATFGSQSINNVAYHFVSWTHTSDSISFVKPMENVTYTLKYEEVLGADFEELQGTKLSIYPNPFGNEGLKVRCRSQFRFRITDMSGVVLEEGQGNSNSILATQLNSGMYLLSIETDRDKQISKIIRK